MPPFAVIISGLPGAGKSTLSKRLSRDLGYIVVCRDRMSTIFGEVRAALGGDGNRLMGKAVDALVVHVAGAVLDAGHGVVIDNNFNWHWQIDTVRTLIRDRAIPAFEVRLWGDATTLRRRWEDREPELAGRADLGPVLEAAYAKPREYVLDSGHSRVELDSTDLDELDAAYPALLDQIRAEVRAAAT